MAASSTGSLMLFESVISVELWFIVRFLPCVGAPFCGVSLKSPVSRFSAILPLISSSASVAAVRITIPSFTGIAIFLCFDVISYMLLTISSCLVTPSTVWILSAWLSKPPSLFWQISFVISWVNKFVPPSPLSFATSNKVLHARSVGMLVPPPLSLLRPCVDDPCLPLHGPFPPSLLSWFFLSYISSIYCRLKMVRPLWEPHLGVTTISAYMEPIYWCRTQEAICRAVIPIKRFNILYRVGISGPSRHLAQTSS